MSITKITPPPKDLDSFLGRKWLESINRQNEDLGSIVDLPFILDVVSALLPNSRALTVASNLTITDGGPGGNFQIGLNVANGNIFTADQSVPDEAYGAGWNGSVEVPTKNAIYDKIQTLAASIPSAYTNEDAQDAVGAMVDATLSYVDGTPLLGVNLSNANVWAGKQGFSTPTNLKGYTVATLPIGVIGDICYVTDALAPAYLTAIVGGGAVVTPVFFDGVAWVAH